MSRVGAGVLVSNRTLWYTTVNIQSSELKMIDNLKVSKSLQIKQGN